MLSDISGEHKRFANCQIQVKKVDLIMEAGACKISQDIDHLVDPFESVGVFLEYFQGFFTDIVILDPLFLGCYTLCQLRQQCLL